MALASACQPLPPLHLPPRDMLSAAARFQQPTGLGPPESSPRGIRTEYLARSIASTYPSHAALVRPDIGLRLPASTQFDLAACARPPVPGCLYPPSANLGLTSFGTARKPGFSFCVCPLFSLTDPAPYRRFNWTRRSRKNKKENSAVVSPRPPKQPDLPATVQ